MDKAPAPRTSRYPHFGKSLQRSREPVAAEPSQRLLGTVSEEDESEGKPNNGQNRIIGCLQQTFNHSKHTLSSRILMSR